MSTHKYFDYLCVAAIIVSLLLCLIPTDHYTQAQEIAEPDLGYADHLFDTSYVHTIDITIDNWEEFLTTCPDEEYADCSVTIDGETMDLVAIRSKGNGTLSTVANNGSSRYSWKIEFDHYEDGKTYHGLDKLALNNLVQDNTYLKDYLAYEIMRQFGVAAPLCSFAYVKVNGEELGLYLAVESIEDGFLQRNFGSSHGHLYKPDNLTFSNGMGMDMGAMAGMMSEMMAMELPLDETAIRTAFTNHGYDIAPLDGLDFSGVTFVELMNVMNQLSEEQSAVLFEAMQPAMMEAMESMGSANGGSFFSAAPDVLLQYVDDNPNSYPYIFSSAKTEITRADKLRLIASLKTLSAYTNLETVLNMDQVLRYFVVHNFIVNDDSYTGFLVHNYYLYEENGRLSILPWDYNLGYGSYYGNDPNGTVNYPIDEVLTDRPMQSWIFSNEAYTQTYLSLYEEFVEQVDMQGILDKAIVLISPYVQKDPTAFCTYGAFEAGAAVLKEYCVLRRESVLRQLGGNTEPVDAGHLRLADMGTSNSAGGVGGGMGLDIMPMVTNTLSFLATVVILIVAIRALRRNKQ